MTAAERTAPLRRAAEGALERMRAAGFEHAQATAQRDTQHELNLAHDEPSLLRSGETTTLSLVGLIDGRRASAELPALDGDAVAVRVAALYDDAIAAPQDDANAVSSGQRARIVKGPQHGDAELLADRAAELIAFRRSARPTAMIEEAAIQHRRIDAVTLTSGATDLESSVGFYDVSVMASARDGTKVSSFAVAGGAADRLDDAPLAERFGIAGMLADCERGVDTQPLGELFVGSVVLQPAAVADLVRWLLEQIGDTQLIAGTSVYRDRVGASIAAPSFTLTSDVDAPGACALTADGFAAQPVTIVDHGRLAALAPSFYASRKTGLAHLPLGACRMEVAAGGASVDDLVAGVDRGVLVGRLSMGNPASNGDFSGVVKNAFRIDSGRRTHALAETMITGNVAAMLAGITGVSRERTVDGTWLLPWLRVTGVTFS